MPNPEETPERLCEPRCVLLEWSPYHQGWVCRGCGMLYVLQAASPIRTLEIKKSTEERFGHD